MAFTEAQLNAQLDPSSTGRTITIGELIIGPTTTDVYAIGVTSPYAGRSRWIQMLSTLTPAQAATAIQNGLA